MGRQLEQSKAEIREKENELTEALSKRESAEIEAYRAKE